MDADESDKDISSCIENNSDEESSEEGSEEGSDDDDSDENEDGTDALSEEEDEDGENVSGDDDDGGEVASTAAAEEDSDKEDLGDPDMSCPICLNEFAGQDLGSPENCSHTFCFECIVEWSKNINTCPIDRIEFHLIYLKQEINGDVIKKVKVKVQRQVEEYVEEVTLCEVCRLGDREDRLLLCDSCDSGYHCECLDPPLENIPIEEWFCPPCARVLNKGAGSPQASHSRLIARTSASEIVRSRIQQHRRVANSSDSGSEITQQPQRVRSPARAPTRKRKMTKRKTKRKTTRKSPKSKTKQARTKATAAGKSKTKKVTRKTPTKRKRKTKKRKSGKKKKKSKKSWLASMKLVAPSVKKRIADHLGLCKPPPGHTMPYVKKSGGQHSVYVEQLPSLDMFGCREQLLDFSESDDDLNNPRPSTSKQRSQVIASRSSAGAASVSGINLLDNILEKQNDLLRSSRDITIGKDGSLNLNEKNSVKVKCGKNEPKNDVAVLEQNKTVASLSTSACVKKENDVSPTDSSQSDSEITAEDSPSSASALSCRVKEDTHRQVRFSDTNTVFKMEKSDACEEIGKTLLAALVEGKHHLPCSLSKKSKEIISSSGLPVCVKKEKDDDSMLNCTMGQAMDISFDVNSEKKNKEHRMNGKDSHQFYKDGIISPVSVLDAMHRQKFDGVVDGSTISTNKLNASFNAGGFNSAKDVPSSSDHDQQKSTEHIKTDKTSASLFRRAENDRKRHLPFLPNGLQRPFKIPKLSKNKDKSSVSEVKLEPSENVNNNLDTKAVAKSENVGNLISEELLPTNETSWGDFRLKDDCQNHAFADRSEAMAVELCSSQSSTPKHEGNGLLHATKKEKVKELCKNHKKNDMNSKSSLHVTAKQSDPKNSHSRGRHSSKHTGSSSEKAVNRASPASLNSEFAKTDKNPHVVSSSSKRLKSAEYKPLLNISGSELQTAKPSESSSTEENGEVKIKACGQTSEMFSKQKLKEDIAAEIKKHLKDFYVTDLITKDEYKEIMRRSVPKVFQNCGNSIDSAKIRKLVISYVHIISGTKPDSS